MEVAVAVILRGDGRFLLAQRPQGKPYSGYWEFPGGKLEPGESVEAALCRELHEELGIELEAAYPWLTRAYDYPHAKVRLHFRRVVKWRGEPHGKEDQRLAWQSTRDLTVSPLLPANGPILRALDLPPVYAITHAAQWGGNFIDRLEMALAQGLRLVQVREKHMGPSALRGFAMEVVRRCRPYQARVLINSDPELARESGADGVHFPAAELMALGRRPDFPMCAASCHDSAELERAAQLGLDFVVLGPALPTPSHPGASTLGWDGLSELLRDYPLPVYALGGLRPEDLAAAWRSGAHGIAMMRAAWLG